MSDWLAGVLAVTLVAVAAAVLYVAWRQRRAAVVGAAVAIFILAVVAWRLWVGAEFAAVLAPCALTLAAWIVAWRVREWRAPRGSRPRGRHSFVPARRALAVGGRVLVAGPLAAVACLPPGVALAGSLPVAAPSAIAAGFFLFVLLWALAMLWAGAAPRLRAPALALSLFGGVNAAVLMMIGGP